MKLCADCNIEKPESEFYMHKTGRKAGKLQHICKKCSNQRVRDWYKTKSPKVQALNRKKGQSRRRRLQDMIDKAKDVPCADCGIKYPPFVMHFDHLVDKIDSIARMVKNKLSVETILKEIAKCQVVCANCHAIRTFTRGQHKHLGSPNFVLGTDSSRES